jgi:hypothetical protein
MLKTFLLIACGILMGLNLRAQTGTSIPPYPPAYFPQTPTLFHPIGIKSLGTSMEENEHSLVYLGPLSKRLIHVNMGAWKPIIGVHVTECGRHEPRRTPNYSVPLWPRQPS